MLHSVENLPYRKPANRLLPWLLMGVLLLALLFVILWLLLQRGAATGVETQIVLPSERAPLMTSLREQPPIFWSTIIASTALVMALLVALSPLSWWMHLVATFGWGNGARMARSAVQHQEVQAAEQWVAAQAAFVQEAQAAANPAEPPGAQPTAQNQPVAGTVPPPGVQSPGGAAPAPQPGAQPGAQPPGTPAPGTPPPGVTPEALPAGAQAPGAPQPAPQPAPPGTQPPGAPPSQNLQALLAQEEKLDIEELTDIGDIMSSFKESDEISPYLLALSNSLDEVDVMTLITKSRQVATDLATGTRRPTGK